MTLHEYANAWLDVALPHAAGVAVLVALVWAIENRLRLSVNVRYGLWLACLGKCLVPPFVVLAAHRTAELPASGLVFVEHVSSAVGDVSTTAGLPIIEALFLAWCVWVAGSAGWIVSRNVLLHRRLKDARPVSVGEVGAKDMRPVEFACPSPFVTGVLKPTLALPLAWRGWRPEFLRAVIAHERAHSRSGDVIVVFAEAVAFCLLGFHPAIWLVRRRLHLLRELRADAAVVLSGAMRPADYADSLVDVHRLRKPALGAVGLRSSVLAERVRHLLSTEGSAMSSIKLQFAVVVLAIAMLVPLSVRGFDSSAGASIASPPPAPSKTADQLEFFQLKKEERPVLVSSVAPVYPDEARAKKLSGKVFLRFKVSESGVVDSVQVLKGSEVLNEAAIEAVRQWRFRPATADGKPVAVWMSQALKFHEAGATQAPSDPAYLMQMHLSFGDRLRVDYETTMSVDEAMANLKQRMNESDLRTVTVFVEPSASDEVVRDVITKLRRERVEVRVTMP